MFEKVPFTQELMERAPTLNRNLSIFFTLQVGREVSAFI